MRKVSLKNMRKCLSFAIMAVVFALSFHVALVSFSPRANAADVNVMSETISGIKLQGSGDKQESFGDNSDVYDEYEKIIVDCTQNQCVNLDEKQKSLVQSTEADKSVTNTANDFNDYFAHCTVCTVFNIIFDTINELSYVVWERSKTSFITLLAVLLGLWFLFRFGGMLMSLVPQSPADFWRVVGVVIAKVIFVVAILSVGIGDFVGSFIVAPVVYTASDFTEAIVKGYTGLNESFDEMAANYKSEENYYTGDNLYLSFGKEREMDETLIPKEEPMTLLEVKELQKKIDEADGEEKAKLQGVMMRSVLWTTTSADGLASCSDGMTRYADEMVTFAIIKEQEFNRQAKELAMQHGVAEGDFVPVFSAGARIHGILNIGVKVAFLCMIDAMNRELAFGKGVGTAIMKYGLTAWRPGFAPFFGAVPLPDIVVITAGFLIWFTCFVLTLIFCFKLLDACFRLGVLSVIMPLLLIAFIFPSTKEYAKRGLSALIQIVCVFVIMSIILALSVLLVMQAFQSGTPTDDTPNIQTLYNLGKIKEIHEQMNLTARGFLGALASMVFSWLSLSMVDATAAEFSGVGFGTVVGDTAGAMVGKAAATVTQMGGRGAKLAGSKMKGKSGK